MDIRNELVKQQDIRNAPKSENRNEEHGQAPRLDSKRGIVVRTEGKPGADVDEAGAVQNEVND